MIDKSIAAIRIDVLVLGLNLDKVITVTTNINDAIPFSLRRADKVVRKVSKVVWRHAVLVIAVLVDSNVVVPWNVPVKGTPILSLECIRKVICYSIEASIVTSAVQIIVVSVSIAVATGIVVPIVNIYWSIFDKVASVAVYVTRKVNVQVERRENYGDTWFPSIVWIVEVSISPSVIVRVVAGA